MGAIGTALLDFGVAPGSDKASIAVTGQTGILSSSACEAWIDGTAAATADHTVDEHIMVAQALGIVCSAIVSGTGFTINGATNDGPLIGKFNIAWVWT